mmetsp:Transcript_34866/g.80635  ORF Transcript_34866/g.80635 Transcript_34866/m.80635 type:complete len:181 (-) Transcript_34866:86-628(-)
MSNQKYQNCSKFQLLDSTKARSLQREREKTRAQARQEMEELRIFHTSRTHRSRIKDDLHELRRIREELNTITKMSDDQNHSLTGSRHFTQQQQQERSQTLSPAIERHNFGEFEKFSLRNNEGFSQICTDSGKDVQQNLSTPPKRNKSASPSATLKRRLNFSVNRELGFDEVKFLKSCSNN